VVRVKERAVALETTLLLHGVPRSAAASLAQELASIVRTAGAEPALIGIVDGQPIAGLNDAELHLLLDADVPKLNLANLGLAIHRKTHGATTVSTTMAIAAQAGIRLFATGGIGGVHPGYGTQLDISVDLLALSRFPVAVVTSGCKAILEVQSTREALESLGVPVVGFGTDHFPAFYLRQSGAMVDARFDDLADLAAYCSTELKRSGRGIVIANPIPEADEIDAVDWERWLTQARNQTAGAVGRDRTPALLGALHTISGGATLRANLALVRANAALAARLAVAMG
jgi:pseudouridine-5'-phosphate glycosidase